MRVSKVTSCGAFREELIDLLLQGKMPSQPLADHLAACSSCRSFWTTLAGLPGAFALPDLYTPGLKYRTLQRLTAETESLDRGFFSLLIPAGLLNLLFWFAVPLAVLTWLLDYWFSRPWFSLLLSTFLLVSLGFLLGLLAFVSLTRGAEADQLEGRTKHLLEKFHV